MNHSNKLQCLFELGEIDHDTPWLDYLTYGLSEADVPALVALVGNKRLQNADYDSNEIWVPNHAWRALGQIASATAVEPLLALLESDMTHDIWATEELPVVLGMIGVEAIIPLATYLRSSDHSEEARIIAAECLKSVAQENDTCRDQVVQIFTTYLVKPDKQPTLNGIVVCCLVDLNARDAMETIRALYDTEAVDISYAGDTEDVEISLGYREARSTPQPTHGHAHGRAQSAVMPAQSSNNLDEEISHYLQKYGSVDAINNISELDGFFAALGCGPDAIQPSAWLPGIWGGDDAMPEWPNSEEANKFISAVMVTYNRTVQALNSDTYAPLFDENRKDGKRITHTDEWCRGFMRGVNLWQTLGTADALFLKDQLQPIRLFSDASGDAHRNAMNEATITYQQRAIAASVRHMHQHWLTERAPMNAPTKAAPKISRNDPCPCGSGKKFKKCCLH